ncbi:glycosyltransferase [Streptomyces sp. NBC_01803]|uniref:glycosyltransferase n=1 Tax=Streptomyces sp. NBC_01803 TaxID=2975946 RepID=UPI002DDAF920|nr:glycosyltransferase [Streptomyces sp. NBC_01803]WSA43028.1 glycosyltransferase [Streptomyces sp. NBC_01803]
MTGLGSRGDVQPTVVLAAELARRGHEVSVALPADLLDFGARLGLTTVSIGVRAKDFLESEEGRRLLADGQSGKYVKGLLAYKLKVADGPQAVLTEMARDADVMVTGLITEDETACIAEARGIPLVCLHHAPRRQNGAFPSVFVPQHRYPRFVNRLTHTLAYHAEWRMTGGYVNRFRAKLGLPPAEDPTPVRLARSGAAELQAYSRHIVPELADWDPHRPLVGFLGLSREQRRLLGEDAVDPALAEWLAAGEPPAFFGFGSMPVRDVPGTLAVIEKVSRTLGVRALVGAGWSAFDIGAGGVDPARVRVVGGFNHDAVLPRCRFAVHHGGAGTTAASIGAGLPTVVCSVAFDQPFWGRQLERLGVGRTLLFTDLSERALTRAAAAVLAPDVRRRARRLAALLRGEDAVGRAADLIEKTVAER